MLNTLIRALRLPFVSASVLPFIYGSTVSLSGFDFPGFLFGLGAVLFAHLSANLINDYADSKSGADWQDRRPWGLFGGSKLIQEKVLTESWYRAAAVLCAGLACVCVFLLALSQRHARVILYFAAILGLSWAYSQPPLRFAYRKMGETIVFWLFGPAVVMGGYFIQTGIFPDVRSFALSLPFGFLVTAILVANEVPDFPEDRKCAKYNLISLVGHQRAHILYGIIILAGLLCVLINVIFRYAGYVSLATFFLLIPFFKAREALRTDYADKAKLVVSSRLTIFIQTWASIILILDNFICRR